MLQIIENFLFRFRAYILITLAIVTVFMAYFASGLRMDAGFEKMLPIGHEYIDTFQKYRDDFAGGNRIIIVLEAAPDAQGKRTIFTPEYLKVLKAATDDVFYISGVSRPTLASLWTPNTRFLEITEEGINAGDVIPAEFQADAASMALVRANVQKAGIVGRMVSNNYEASMISAELQDIDPETRDRLDYFKVADALEAFRDKYEKDGISVKIVGFAKVVGDIKDGAESVVFFMGAAFLLTVMMLWLYCRSWRLTFVTLSASLCSLVWQFGILNLMGFGLDPLAVLVPFLVFAIGVSHGVQQINMVSAEIANGKDKMTAARDTFHFLLVPGSVALCTCLAGFGTLYLIPIGMIRELSITASIGIALKIVSNLVMLPLLASYIAPTGEYARQVKKQMEKREKVWPYVARIAKPRNAWIMVIGCLILGAVGVYVSKGLQIGDVHAGAAELRPDSRYNQDTRFVVGNFDIGVNILTVIVETPEGACVDHKYMSLLDRFQWEMANVPGVQSTIGLPLLAKMVGSMWREGNLKWYFLPRNTSVLAQAVGPIPTSTMTLNTTCTVLPLLIFTKDSKAITIKGVVNAVKEFRAKPENQLEGMNIRLAAGSIGVTAATNEVVEEQEIPMLLWVYAVVIGLVLLTYREWRGSLCCVVPLVLSTIIGNMFLTLAQIGLKISTLPVLAIAVGIGVDYGIYEYNRIQRYMRLGKSPFEAYEQALKDVGSATMFTGFTLAVGVSTWSFSALKFQADMGMLLTFMFMVNMIGAVTLLPAMISIIDQLLPKKYPPLSEEERNALMRSMH
ncbi:efflux RND transporter permease subunit [Oleomonas cavernae]|uniref:efflux RND transporter permease subunit n=1 Tax=Oleomonas cavernae TaxID=2320859 RepID=UPI0018F66622|nr:efflux RND transporter permease subunit [Oleomonas cavernae]